MRHFPSFFSNKCNKKTQPEVICPSQVEFKTLTRNQHSEIFFLLLLTMTMRERMVGSFVNGKRLAKVNIIKEVVERRSFNCCRGNIQGAS